ncbi:MAG: hypothetical protein V2A61_00710 [Calditrichota bacterium]
MSNNEWFKDPNSDSKRVSSDNPQTPKIEIIVPDDAPEPESEAEAALEVKLPEAIAEEEPPVGREPSELEYIPDEAESPELIAEVEPEEISQAIPAPTVPESPSVAATIPEAPRGEPFNKLEILGVLVLVDIAPEVRRRGLPEIFPLEKPKTIIGTNRRAQVRVDDIKTVRGEHAAIYFSHDQFYIVEQEGCVFIDAKTYHPSGIGPTGSGVALKNGSRIDMGSARFIFLTNTKLH